ncbi:UNVERIFIED_CONTAM: hypothetical protein K2H54_053283 [Gekko kuhli]
MDITVLTRIHRRLHAPGYDNACIANCSLVSKCEGWRSATAQIKRRKDYKEEQERCSNHGNRSEKLSQSAFLNVIMKKRGERREEGRLEWGQQPKNPQGLEQRPVSVFKECAFLEELGNLAGVPSGPRNVISIVNETSIILEWHPPRETGGRDDVTYNIVCKKCRSDRRSCSRCDDNVEFVPRQLGLTETRVFISNLWAHTPYTFEIQAVNGVSNKSPFPPQHVSVNITTNQAGAILNKWLLKWRGDIVELEWVGQMAMDR